MTRRYVLAAVFVALGLAVRLALDPILDNSEPLLIFIPAILAATRFGGRGPGLAATALSLVAAWFFFLDPCYSFAVANLRDLAGLALIAVSGAGISLLQPAGKSISNTVTSSEPIHSFLRRIALPAGAIVILLVMTRVIYTDVQQQQDDQSRVTHTYQVLNEAHHLASLTERAQAEERGYLLTGDQRYRETLQTTLQAEDTSRQTLRHLTSDNPNQKARMDTLDRLVQTRLALLLEIMRLRDTKGMDAALNAIQTGDGRKLMEEVRTTVNAIQEEERELLAERTTGATNQFLRTRWLLGLGNGCLLLVLVLAGTVIEHDIKQREQAKTAMRRSEERLRLALDSANAGTWEWDLRTNENVWSEEMWRLYGLEPYSCKPSYEAWLHAIHPDDRARAEETVGQAASAGNELEMEFRVGDSGAPRWLLSRGRPIKDSKGPGHFIGIVLDITERKLAEEALRERERNLRRFTEAAPVAIAMFDREMRYLAASERYRTDFNLGTRELAGHSHYEIFPEITELWRETHRRCLAGAPAHNDGELFLREDGSEQWIRWSIQPWTRVDGNIGGIVLFCEEITSQKRSEQAVRESEAQFRTLANTIPQLCWMAGANGDIFWYNQRWYNYTGATLQQMEGWRWQSVHDPQVLPQVVERWKRSIATGEPFEMVFPIRGADGIFRPFLTRVMPVHDGEGKVARWFGTNTDISDQRRTEEALRESEQRFRKVFEHAPTGIAISDLDGQIEQCNPALCALLGYSREELQGVWFGSLIPTEDRQATLVQRERAQAGEIPSFQIESRYLRKNGPPVWVHKFVSVLPSETPGQARFVALITDISKPKQAEEAIRQLNAQLERRVRERTGQLEAANRELEAFAYSVSHDLRTPLRGIDGWSLALLEDYGAQLDLQAHQYLERVRSETQRMGMLIDDLLQLSRITRAEMQHSEVDLSALARTVAHRLRDSHPGRSIEFCIASGMTAACDARLMEIALTNFFSNAVKFTGPRTEARIEFSRSDNLGKAEFYIRDNGVGFDMAYAKMLFGAFQRLHKTSEFPGTGIGLATVQRIIHRHGGRVWAEAQPGNGATFYFTLGEK